MCDRVRAPVPASLPLIPVTLLLLALHVPGAAAQPPPSAHHPGVWTNADKWPGRTTWPSSVWAVHMALTRGDTLFARPHSRVLAWGNWAPVPNGGDGGVWAWNPTTNLPAAAAQNLVEDTGVARPPMNVFCAGHAGLPNGDLLIVGGTERNIVGLKQSARFEHQTRAWTSQTQQERRWYANATPLADGRLLATAGNIYDHMVLFGGRRDTDNLLRSDVQRYAITAAGEWDPALSGTGPDWPEPREHHTLADPPEGVYYLFGGRGASALLNDFWQLKRTDDDDFETYAWTKHPWPTAFDGPSRPLERWRHVAAVDRIPNTDPSFRGVDHFPMYVFGGDDGATTANVFGDLWKLEWFPALNRWRWTQLTGATGIPPGARTGATALWDESDNRMILFGGEGPGGALADNQVYVLRISSGGVPDWHVAPLASGSDPAPAARALHAMGADPKLRSPAANGGVGTWFHAVVFGGQTSSGPSDELFELYVEPATDAVKWIKRNPTGPAPARRKRASLIVYDEYPGSAVVLGGELESGAWDAVPWEIGLFLVNTTWSPRNAPTPSFSLRGQTAFRENRALTALRPEVYDPTADSWSAYGPASSRFRSSYHIIFSASDGKLYSPGPNKWHEDITYRFDPVAGSWSTFLSYSGVDALDATNSGVLYRPNKMMKVGDNDLNPLTGEFPTVSRTLQIDEVTPQWRFPAMVMSLGRAEHCLSLLPTGEVIMTGGIGEPEDFDNNPSNDKARRRPELWDATYQQGDDVGYWYGAGAGTQLADQSVTRAHHSSAVLLPDGRILSGGGYDNHPDDTRRAVDQYSPPYLFKPGTAPDTVFRPRLYGAQDHITYGQSFKVTCPDPVVAACLLRPGASTHAYNHDNRYVPLSISTSEPQDGHRVTLLSPTDANLAPPGNYLLFVLRDDDGRKVPSIARWVNVGATQTSYATWDTLPPTTVMNLYVAATDQTSRTLVWTAPSDAGDGTDSLAWRYELRFRASQGMTTMEDFFTHGRRVDSSLLPTPGAPGTPQAITVTGLSPDTVYYFRLLSRDGAGSDRNWSALSNEVAAYPPQGGCPFVDTRTTAGWQVENSILGRSLSGALALDGYRLRHAPEVVGGRVRLRVRENEQERTTLDQVRLVAVDHAPGVRAWPMGEEVVLGTRVAAERVTTSAGVDVTALVNGNGEGFAGAPGDTLLVELSSGAHVVAGEERATQSHNPFHIDDGGKCPPDCGSPLRSPAGEYSASAIDAQVLGSSGIQLQVPDGLGGWRTVVTRYPREHADQAVFEGLGHGPVRLVFVGRHRVRFVGRIEHAGGEVVVQRLPLLVARHSRLGDVAAALDTTGARTSELAPGDTLSLEFGWTPLPEGQVRELFFLSHGIYTAILPSALSQVLPERFTIHKPRPNPFAGSTTLRFDLPLGRHVRLEVLDAQGRRVRTLANHALPPGSHAIEWDGRNEAGSRTGAGIYFYRFEAGEFREQGRMTFMP